MHVHDLRTGKILRYSTGLMLALAVAEAAASYYSGSLALGSDAAHNFADSLALTLAWIAFYLQSKPPTEVKTYGYQRAGVLAAFVNALVLVAISAFIFYEAAGRFRFPPAIRTGWMMWVAAGGFAINAFVSLRLYGRAHGDVNLRTAFLHTAADAGSTAAIVVGAWLIRTTGLLRIDPLLGVLIAALILWSSVDIIRETLNILLEGLPRGMRLDAVICAIQQVKGVESVHDVHIWSLGSSAHALSCHVAIADITASASAEILRRINQLLDRQFHISHTTIQFENLLCDPGVHCIVPSEQPLASARKAR